MTPHADLTLWRRFCKIYSRLFIIIMMCQLMALSVFTVCISHFILLTIALALAIVPVFWFEFMCIWPCHHFVAAAQHYTKIFPRMRINAFANNSKIVRRHQLFRMHSQHIDIRPTAVQPNFIFTEKYSLLLLVVKT